MTYIRRLVRVLDEGADSGEYGIDVLSGAATAEQVEERLLHHARLMTGM